MKVFRISTEKYAQQLTASGAANRWNKAGEFVLYTGSSRSLSSLEMVVHRSSIQPHFSYKVMVIHLPDDDRLIETLKFSTLGNDWRNFSGHARLQKLGSEWYRSQSSLILKVPSVIIPQEFNYVINSKHSDFQKHIKLVEVEDYFWDGRLL